MTIFIAHPLLAFVPALLFGAGYVHHRIIQREFRPARLIVLSTALVWLEYGVHELSGRRQSAAATLGMQGDLLFFEPALLMITVVGAIAYVLGMKSGVK